MKVYVCYELNNHELAIDAGQMTDLTVCSTKEKAKKWFIERAEKGKEEGFIPDTEDMMTGEGDAIVEKEVEKEIEKGYAQLTMFSGYQENWDESYEICVYEKEVE